jgi:hypothetical protein
MRMIKSSRVTPALFTRMSILPKTSRTSLTTASADSGSDASAWMGADRRPKASTSAAVSAAAAALPLYVNATSAPCLAKRIPIARPIPRAAGDERRLAGQIDHAWTSE